MVIYLMHHIPPCERSKWTVGSSPFLAAWCNAVPLCDPTNGKKEGGGGVTTAITKKKGNLFNLACIQ